MASPIRSRIARSRLIISVIVGKRSKWVRSFRFLSRWLPDVAFGYLQSASNQENGVSVLILVSPSKRRRRSPVICRNVKRLFWAPVLSAQNGCHGLLALCGQCETAESTVLAHVVAIRRLQFAGRVCRDRGRDFWFSILGLPLASAQSTATDKSQHPHLWNRYRPGELGTYRGFHFPFRPAVGKFTRKFWFPRIKLTIGKPETTGRSKRFRRVLVRSSGYIRVPCG